MGWKALVLAATSQSALAFARVASKRGDWQLCKGHAAILTWTSGRRRNDLDCLQYSARRRRSKPVERQRRWRSSFLPNDMPTFGISSHAAGGDLPDTSRPVVSSAAIGRLPRLLPLHLHQVCIRIGSRLLCNASGANTDGPRLVCSSPRQAAVAQGDGKGC